VSPITDPEDHDPDAQPDDTDPMTESHDLVKQWCAVAARAADAKGGEDTLILAVGRVLAITDAFVITSGSNIRQVRTIAEEIEEQVKASGGPAPLRIEGLDDARWVLMDFGDFVVHVLVDEARGFYEIERLWADAEVWPWDPTGLAPTPSTAHETVDQDRAVLAEG
jgi:ribosome-associated protein